MRKSQLKDLIKNHQVKLKKSLGQNYLVDQNFLVKIKAQIELLKKKRPQSLILEIGCGLGVLTDHLLKISPVIGVEIDRKNCQFLKKKHGSRLVDSVDDLRAETKRRASFYLICRDVLQLDLKSIVKNEQKIILVGNLPYHLVYKIILFFLENYFSHVAGMIFLVQKEAAERIYSDAKQKNYGIPTVLVQYYCQCRKLLEVPAAAFYPSPKVRSEFIWLSPKTVLEKVDYTLFKHLVKASFQNRRKNIVNSIKNYLPFKFDLTTIKASLTKLNIENNARGEDLSLNDYLRLTENYAICVSAND